MNGRTFMFMLFILFLFDRSPFAISRKIRTVYNICMYYVHVATDSHIIQHEVFRRIFNAEHNLSKHGSFLLLKNLAGILTASAFSLNGYLSL